MAKRELNPDTSLLTSVFIPYHFEPKTLSTVDGTLIINEGFTIEPDINGLASIIRLNTIPYIDLNMYDYTRKQWYATDQFNNRWRKYDTGDFIPEFNITSAIDSLFINMDGLWGGELISDGDPGFSDFNFVEFTPIFISVNGVVLEDITDYSGDRNVVIQDLDTIDPINNKQFYYDKKSSLFTNQDFDLVEPNDIVITYMVNIKNISVRCRMQTNVKNLSPYTPVVDYYVAQLKGQNL
tara:strand:+ start:329 stop:1042 length:714 start_codon:yes stop_codon:yes gene_type:complete